jgi:choline-sulfatase
MNFFEWSARVPLICYAPGRFAPRRVTRHVSLVDLLPTLVELGTGDGSPPDPAAGVDGQSLVSLLKGDDSQWDDTTLAEILFESAIAPCFMIRRGRYKYIYSEPDPEQLYDLEADPNELENLAGRPGYGSLRSGLFEEVVARWDPHSIHGDVIASQRRRRMAARSLAQGKRTSWDFQPYEDASRQYMRNHMELDDLERRARFPTPEIPAPDGPSTDRETREELSPGLDL